MKKNPTVSVIIPVRNLSHSLLHENLPELAKQTFKNFEIIILPNKPSQYDLSLTKKYKNLRVFPTDTTTRPAQKRDAGVKHSKGNIIAFIDDDAYPDKNWLENAVKLFNKKDVVAVCGPGILPANTNLWEKIFDEMLKTWIGAGGHQYRFTKQKTRLVNDFPSMNFFIKKHIFLKLGGFNNNYWPGEDSKLCNDVIVKEKGRILYSPRVVVSHHRRNNLTAFLKQHAQYGFHRGAFFAHGDQNSRSLAYLIPSLFTLYIIASTSYFASIIVSGKQLQNVYLIFTPLLIYCILIAHLMIKAIINTKNIIIGLGAALSLFLTHIVYGTMFIKGFIKGLNASANIYE